MQVIERHATWNPGRTAARPRVRVSSLPRIRVHPIQWALQYRLASILALLGLAMFVYVLQVNEAAQIDYGLTNVRVQQAQNRARMANLLVVQDRLRSESRIDSIAVGKLHMIIPPLNSALWRTVTVPSRIPTPPKEPAVRTGPLSWLEHAGVVIRDSL